MLKPPTDTPATSKLKTYPYSISSVITSVIAVTAIPYAVMPLLFHRWVLANQNKYICEINVTDYKAVIALENAGELAFNSVIYRLMSEYGWVLAAVLVLIVIAKPIIHAILLRKSKKYAARHAEFLQPTSKKLLVRTTIYTVLICVLSYLFIIYNQSVAQIYQSRSNLLNQYIHDQYAITEVVPTQQLQSTQFTKEFDSMEMCSFQKNTTLIKGESSVLPNLEPLIESTL